MENISLIGQNGLVVKCPGMFDGEFIVDIEDGNESLIFALLSPNPNVDFVLDALHNLTQIYPQCILTYNFFYMNLTYRDIGCEEEVLCAVCLDSCFCSNIMKSKDISFFQEACSKCYELNY